MLTRRKFLASLASIGFINKLGWTLSSTPPKLKKIEVGAVFSIFELETDPRFMSEETLGISLNKSRIFKFREHNQKIWHAGVIVDDGRHWVPYYIDQIYFQIGYRYSRRNPSLHFRLRDCPHAVSAEVHALQENVKFTKALYGVHRCSKGTCNVVGF